MNLLRMNFKPTDKPEEFMSAEDVFNYIKEKISSTNGRIEDIGKPIKAAFGDSCKFPERIKGKTC